MGVGSLRGKYAIAGIGETEYSRNSGRTTRAMAVEAIRNLECISREGVRAAFEERFTVERMAHDYVGVYERVIEEHSRAQDRPMALVPVREEGEFGAHVAEA